MFDWLKFKRSPRPQEGDFRELLFGDVPLASWASNDKGEPWMQLHAAADAMANGDRNRAIELLQAVLKMPSLESRHYVEAWNALRSLGVAPPAPDAKHVYGVVLDVPVRGGLDTLAAYADGSARYLNFSGATVVWGAKGIDPEADSRVDALIAAGRALAPMIGPWEGARPPLATGRARISLLTPSGLHFVEGLLDALSREALAEPLLGAGAALMQTLTAKAQNRAGSSGG